MKITSIVLPQHSFSSKTQAVSFGDEQEDEEALQQLVQDTINEGFQAGRGAFWDTISPSIPQIGDLLTHNILSNEGYKEIPYPAVSIVPNQNGPEEAFMDDDEEPVNFYVVRTDQPTQWTPFSDYGDALQQAQEFQDDIYQTYGPSALPLDQAVESMKQFVSEALYQAPEDVEEMETLFQPAEDSQRQAFEDVLLKAELPDEVMNSVSRQMNNSNVDQGELFQVRLNIILDRLLDHKKLVYDLLNLIREQLKTSLQEFAPQPSA